MTRPGPKLIDRTERRRTIIAMLSEGAETAEIARAMGFAYSTVKKELVVMIADYQVRNRVQLVAKALRSGEIS